MAEDIDVPEWIEDIPKAHREREIKAWRERRAEMNRRPTPEQLARFREEFAQLRADPSWRHVVMHANTSMILNELDSVIAERDALWGRVLELEERLKE